MAFIRFFIIFFGFVFLIISMTLIWGRLWAPWINSYLVGTTLFAYALSILWIGFTRAFRACTGAGIGGLVAFGANAIYFFQASLTDPDYLLTGELSLYFGLILMLFFFIGLKSKKRKEDKTSISAQCLIGLVAVITLLEGIYLIIPMNTHFAWILPIKLSTPYGWICIGACLYFGWGLIYPLWENAYPLLLGLLFYDGLIIGPLFSLFKEGQSVTLVPHLLWTMIIIVIGTGIWSLIELWRKWIALRSH